MSTVAVVKTSPETVLSDYRRVMELAGYREHISFERETLLKLNLSWTKFFPACSSPPWQLEGVVKTLTEDGCTRLVPVENKTVVTNPARGARENRWNSVFAKYGLTFTPLTEVEWEVRSFDGLLALDRIFPEGIEVPKFFAGRNVIHLPTVKTHGHSTTTGAVKNAFGGLLKEVRHYCHKHIHEVLVDLLIMQRELHPGIFAVMDGAICGDGAGPRTMQPHVKNYILASADSVALDAVAARMMGFDPMSIPYIRMATERGLGQGEGMTLAGDDVAGVDFGFKAKKSLVIAGDQMIRKGWLVPLERLLLHSPLMVWAPIASTVYHDWYWYPTVGKRRVREFMRTGWGRLFEEYK
ncbi:MAG: DUF362 domain-containing protein [Armatimonadota bacterium]